MTRPLMLVLLAMTPGAVAVLAESASTSSGPICTIMNPLLPKTTLVTCSCTDTDSGVGGTSICPLTIPAIPLIPAIEEKCATVFGQTQCTPSQPALAIPAMTFSIGATVLPCGTPASASVHGSIVIDLPAGTSLPDGLLAEINGASGVSATVASSKVTIAVEKSVAAGAGESTIFIPLAAGITAQVGLNVAGTIGKLTIAETLDICATAGTKLYCGADIAKIPLVGATAADTLGNPPWELGTFSAGFEDACKEAAAAAAATVTYKVATSFTLSGSPSDYGAAEQDSIKSILAAATTVAASDIDIALTAGSVLVKAEIKASNEAAATTMATALTNGILASSTTMQTALAGGGITSTVSAITPPTVVASGGGGSAGVIVGVIVGAVAVLLLLYVAAKYKKAKTKTDMAQTV